MNRPPLQTFLLAAVIFLGAAGSLPADDAALRWRAAVTGKDPKARLEAAYFPPRGGEYAGAWVEAARDKDPVVRQYAATALGELSPADRAASAAKAVPALIDLLGDPQVAVRDHATLALIKFGVEAVPELAKVLRERGLDQAAAGPGSRTEIREERAQIALMGIGAPAVPALIALAETRHDDWTLAPAAVALARIGPAAVPDLTRALDHKSRRVRRFAALTLGALGRDAGPAAPQLAAIARGDDEDLAVDAAKSLAALGSDGFAPLLEDLAGPAAVRRVNALRALAAGPTDVPMAEKVATELARALADEDARIRYEAARATSALALRLGVKGKSLLPALEKALEDKNAGTRAEAADAAQSVTATLGPDAGSLAPALTAALADADPRVVERACAALGNIGPKAAPAAKQLLALARSPLWGVRRAATTALSRIGSVEIIPALVAGVKEPNNFELKSALLKFPPAVVLAEIEKVLPDATKDYRRDLIWLAGGLARSARDKGPFVNVLRKALSEPDAQVAAAAALVGLGADAADAVPDLLAAAREGPNRVALLPSVGQLGRAVKDKGPFVEVLRDALKEPATAGAAIAALGRLGPDASPAVAELVEAAQKGPQQRQAIEALGLIGPKAKGAIGVLAEYARDPKQNLSVRQAAALALIRIAPAEGWAAYTELPASVSSPAPQFIAALVAHGEPGREPLRSALGDKSAGIRAAAAQALASSDLAKAFVPELIKATADESARVRTGAVRALGRARGPAKEVVPALARAVGDPDVQVRREAVAALGQLDPAAEGVSSALAAAMTDKVLDVRESAARLVARGEVPKESRRLLTAIARDRFTRGYLGEQRTLWRPLEPFAARLCAEYGGPLYLYEYGNQSGYGGGNNSSPAPPVFLWPPAERFAVHERLDRRGIAGDDASLQAVNELLRTALVEKGFARPRLFTVTNLADFDPNFGLALITRHAPHAAGRAAASGSSPDVLDGIAAMAQEGQGEFCVVVVVVIRNGASPQEPGMLMNFNRLKPLLTAEGVRDLPEPLSGYSFGNFQCHVLIHRLALAADGTVEVNRGGAEVIEKLPFKLDKSK